MLIVKIKSDGGFHSSEFQNGRTKCWLPGYVEVPKNLKSTFIASRGYCDLVIEDGVLINIIPRPECNPNTDPAVLTREDEIEALLIEQEYRLTLLELGVNG